MGENFFSKLLIFVAVSALFAIYGCGGSSDIRVGLGETVITPPLGTQMLGYDRGGKGATGVHDDLHARTMVVEGENGVAIALMTVSVLNMDATFMDAIRARITEATGIPGDNIAISCTHTHSGPDIGPIDGEYGRFFIETCAKSAIDAWENLKPGRIGISSVRVLGLGMNDRTMDWGGWHPDPETAVIKIENARGRLIGVAFNYGCHPSTLDLHSFDFTEDWPYFSMKGLKEELGDIWTAYYQSAQGDVKIGYSAELSAIGADIPVRTFEYADYKGRIMTDAVLKLLPGIQTSGSFTVDAVSDHFDFPYREKYPVSLREAQRNLDLLDAEVKRMEANSANLGRRVIDRKKVERYDAIRIRMAAQWAENNTEPSISIRMQALRIGDAVFVTFPNEVFSEIGLKVKQQSPYDKTFVLGVAGGVSDYMPTAAEYLEGGYAVLRSPFDPSCEQVIIDSSLELINRLEN